MKPKRATSSKNLKPDPTASAAIGSSAHDRWVGPLAVGLFLLVVAVFFQARNFGFLNFDDNQYIQEIEAVKAGLTWKSVWWAWTNSHVGQWHPLTSMSFMLDAQLGGLANGKIFHIHNILLQATASVLLFLALRSLTGSVWRSAIAASIFAIHPLRVESVAWITERKDVLSGVFLMATLWAYSHYTRLPSSRGRHLLVCVLFALGLLSKPMLVSLPFVFLLLDVWPLRRLSWDPVPTTTAGWLQWGRQLAPLVWEKMPLFVMAFASAYGAILAVGEPFRPIPILPLIPRLQYIPVSYATYLWQLIYPFNLCAHYPFVVSGPPGWKVVLCSLLLIALTVWAWKQRKNHPYFLVGWLWFLGTMLPVIGLVPGGIQIMADRYTYLTQIGLTTAMVWAVGSWVQSGKLRLSRIAVGALAAELVLGLAVAANLQTRHWQNDRTLWTHALAVSRDNDYAHEKLGTTLQSEGEREQSEQLYREALRLNPRLVGSLNNLSILMRQKGNFQEAVDLQKKAIQEHPKWGLMHRNLASALVGLKQFAEARDAFREAVRLVPNDLEARFSLAITLIDQLGGPEDLEEASKQLQRILELEPRAADAHFLLGNLRYRAGQPEEAAQYYRNALTLTPNHSRAANNLGSVLSQQGKLAEAAPLYKQAITADPSYIDAMRNLADVQFRSRAFTECAQTWREVLSRQPGDVNTLWRLSWMLSTCPDASSRRPFEARDLALKGIEISQGKDPAFHDALAAALAQLGKFPQALESIDKALDLLPKDHRDFPNLQRRRALYAEDKPYVDTLTPIPTETAR